MLFVRVSSTRVWCCTFLNNNLRENFQRKCFASHSAFALSLLVVKRSNVLGRNCGRAPMPTSDACPLISPPSDASHEGLCTLQHSPSSILTTPIGSPVPGFHGRDDRYGVSVHHRRVQLLHVQLANGREPAFISLAPFTPLANQRRRLHRACDPRCRPHRRRRGANIRLWMILDLL